MKSKLVVPAMYAREMIDGPDLDRYLASGSYLIGTRPKKLTAHAIAQRDYMRRQLAAGYKNLVVLLPEHVYSLLQSRLREGESMASLLERLILSFSDNDQIPISDKHK